MSFNTTKLYIGVLLYSTLFLRSVAADGFDIANFKEVYSNGGKEKAAELLYVLPDASIVKKDTAGSSPAIKLVLSNDPENLVMQDIMTPQETKEIHVSVEVWASLDLQHGKGDGEWATLDEPGTYYIQASLVHPNVDFWIILAPGDGYRLSNLERGHWTTVATIFESHRASKVHHFEFHVPAGTGFVYLRNFSVNPCG